MTIASISSACESSMREEDAIRSTVVMSSRAPTSSMEAAGSSMEVAAAVWNWSRAQGTDLGVVSYSTRPQGTDLGRHRLVVAMTSMSWVVVELSHLLMWSRWEAQGRALYSCCPIEWASTQHPSGWGSHAPCAAPIAHTIFFTYRHVPFRVVYPPVIL